MPGESRYTNVPARFMSPTADFTTCMAYVSTCTLLRNKENLAALEDAGSKLVSKVIRTLSVAVDVVTEQSTPRLVYAVPDTVCTVETVPFADA